MSTKEKENEVVKTYTTEEVRDLLETLQLEIFIAVRKAKCDFLDEMISLLKSANQADIHVSNFNTIYKHGQEGYDKSISIVKQRVDHVINHLSEE